MEISELKTSPKAWAARGSCLQSLQVWNKAQAALRKTRDIHDRQRVLVDYVAAQEASTASLLADLLADLLDDPHLSGSLLPVPTPEMIQALGAKERAELEERVSRDVSDDYEEPLAYARAWALMGLPVDAMNPGGGDDENQDA